MAKKKSRKGRSGDILVILASRPRAAALAALHISESLLLELEASEILTAREIRGVLKDAAATLRNATDQVDNGSSLAACDIVESMLENFKKGR
jgi:hypothetical protein